MSLAGRTILLVDDEAFLTQLVSDNLRKNGATVLIRRNGAELCEAAQQLKPDLIITDYQMPLLNGFAACVKLKADPATASIPVIMLTARGHRLNPSELIQTNIRSVFPKPFSVKQLHAQIEELLAEPVSARAPTGVPPRESLPT